VTGRRCGLLPNYVFLTFQVLLPARRCASAVLAVIVCPSVTSQCSTKTAKPRITQTSPYNSPGTLVVWYQKSRRNSKRVNYP